MSSRKHYSEEFKLEASRLVVEQGYTYKAASERLGVNYWSIRDWIRKFRKNGTLPAVGQAVAEAEEMKTLRKENSQLRMEVEILKKAAAYFAKESL